MLCGNLCNLKKILALSGTGHRAKAFVLSELVELLRNGQLTSCVPVAPDQSPRVVRLSVLTQTGRQDVGIIIGTLPLGDFSTTINDLIWNPPGVDVLVVSCCSGLRGSAGVVNAHGIICGVVPDYIEFKASPSAMPTRLVVDAVVKGLYNRIVEA